MAMNMGRKQSSNNYRYERKYIVPSHWSNEVLLTIKKEMECTDLYEQRQVNSIYFDTDDLKFAQQNISGDSTRVKLRLRYYGNIDNFYNPHFEEKIKRGNTGTKNIYEVDNCPSDLLIQSLDINKKRSNLPCDIQNLLMNLKPIILITYFRQYLVTKDKKFRLTYDNNIRCIPLTFNNIPFSFANKKFFQYQYHLLEVKYGISEDKELSNLMKRFPLRVSKSSKYIAGLNLIRKIDLI